MSFSWFKYPTLNMFLILVAGSCTSQVVDSPKATATAMQTEAVTTSIPPTQMRTAYPPPAPTQDPSTFLFDSLQMISESIGWATAELSDSLGENWSTRILRTTDGGLNWLDVSPASDLQRTEKFFLDGENAWAITHANQTDPAESLEVLVWQAHNGGSTWTRGTLSVRRGMISEVRVFFLDAQHGWLINTYDVAMGTTAVTLYKTEDGGTNWAEILSTALDDLPRPGAMSLACYKEHLWFRDTSTGWVMGGCWSDPDILFAVTHDGGLTWQTQELPQPGDPLTGPSCSPYPPTFFSSQEGVLQIVCPTTSLLIYHTHDGAQTWDRPVHRTRLLTTTPVDFVDANNGWYLATEDSPTNDTGVGLYVTHDGGKTWDQITPIIDVGDIYGAPPNGNDLELIRHFDFIDTKTGWAVRTVSDMYDYSLILKTTDGGYTWTHWVPHWQLRSQ